MLITSRFQAFCILFSCAFSSVILAEIGSEILGNPEEGKAKSVLCVACHGERGEGKAKTADQPAMPRLAGQIPGYFIKSMQDYRTDMRTDPIMNAITKGLTDADIANLDTYYGALK